MDFYQTLLQFFMDPTQVLLSNVGDEILESLKLPFLGNALVSLALMAWGYQRVRLGDMFSSKTLFSLAGFAGFFTLFNYAWKHSQDFYTKLKILVFYGSDVLMGIVRSSLQNSSLGLENLSLDFAFLTNQTFHTLGLLLQTMDASTLQVHEMLVLGVLLSQGALLTLLLALALMVAIEIYLWLALGILVLPLGFFASTRPMLWLYLKKCVALSFYQPIVVLLACYNARVLQTLIPVLNTPQAYETYVLVIISALLELFLIQRVPHFIQSLFHTQGGVKDMVHLVGLGRASFLQNVQTIYHSGVSNTAQHSHATAYMPQEMSLHVQTLSDSKPHIDTTTFRSTNGS
ncbi:type IV secretion system protein [Helicobacter salomonis]|uniref:type IV secretion system protein n=1 Tax=Helicobacter salomonis TaxID=56878 RepID=UPI001F28FDEC|nr:type IV secretion system protein [Helicobacter salomonis]